MTTNEQSALLAVLSHIDALRNYINKMDDLPPELARIAEGYLGAFKNDYIKFAIAAQDQELQYKIMALDITRKTLSKLREKQKPDQP